MDPERMNLEQLAEEVRKEQRRRADRDARTERAMSPVEVKAPTRGVEVGEELAWRAIGIVVATLTLACLWWGFEGVRGAGPKPRSPFL